MKICGVIAEFNPFHNGHEYLLNKTKEFSDGTVVVMSGNFTQRGEPAIAEKRQRARAALLGGADLVIELPVAFSVSGAQTFARGGVKALCSLGCVDYLAFGSESGNADALSLTAKRLEVSLVQNEIHRQIQTGVTFACARERALKTVFGENAANAVKEPNDILAVEYVSALRLFKSKITPVAVKRTGCGHNSDLPQGEFASGSFLRQRLLKNEDVSEYIPDYCAEIINENIIDKTFPADYGKLEAAVLAFLRKATGEDLASAPDVSEGIENRILSASKSACTLSEVFDNAKTKRYTHARIRRIALCAFLGIKSDDVSCGLPYLRVLGFNKTGREILKNAKETARLPIIMRASDVASLGKTAERAFSLECTATDIYNLSLPKIRPCGTEMTDNPIIIE